jgi:hypothetical protein
VTLQLFLRNGTQLQRLKERFGDHSFMGHSVTYEDMIISNRQGVKFNDESSPGLGNIMDWNTSRIKGVTGVPASEDDWKML